MADPERPNYKQELGEVLKLAKYPLAIIAGFAIGWATMPTEEHEPTNDLVARCAEKHPISKRNGDTQTNAGAIYAYLTNPDRNELIEEQIMLRAQKVVQKVNEGDSSYSFLMAESPDGTSSKDHYPGWYSRYSAEVPDDYEGYGRLDTIQGSKGDIIFTEHVEGIWRNSDGQYEVPLQPQRLTLSNQEDAERPAYVSFSSPDAQGLHKCATVAGNEYSRGWTTEYYDLNFDKHGILPNDAIQSATYTVANSNAALNVETDREMDRRGLNLLDSAP